MASPGRWIVPIGLLVVVGLLATGTAVAAPPDDPESDVLGWENGYWHNESIEVEQSDGLSDAELEAYVSRAMARIEVIREREFNGTVPVEVIPRSEFANRTDANASESYRAWNNQVWEALFVVGEDEDVVDVLHSTSSAATTGSYFVVDDEIKIITEDPDDVSIGRGTLVHELVHAQQDQYHDLANVSASPETQDEELAVNGLVEGEANYVEDRYQERCGVEWECVDAPSSPGGSGGSDLNRGVLYTIFHPYSDGPPYVHSLVERDGWSAIDAGFESPPNSTEQIIHHTDEAPAPLDVRDRARNGWEPFVEQGRNGTDTVGEASIFVMLWYQAWEYEADTIPVSTLGDTDDPYDTFNYESVPSSNWANDEVRPYRRNTDLNGTEYGYVWTTEWDSETDATQFLAAHRAVLRAHDARQLGQRTWVVDSGPYADAYRVVRAGNRVTIVNAPAVDDLADLRPDIQSIPLTPTPTDSATPVGRDTPSQRVDTQTRSAGGESTPPVEQPGFGALAALLALVLSWLAYGSRRR